MARTRSSSSTTITTSLGSPRCVAVGSRSPGHSAPRRNSAADRSSLWCRRRVRNRSSHGRRTGARSRRPGSGRGPVPLPTLLGRVERIEGLRHHLRRHASAAVGDRDQHILAGRNREFPRECVVDDAFDVSIVSLPPLGMASRALTDRLMIAFSSWPGSALICHRPAASTVSHRDRLAQRAAPGARTCRRPSGWR